MPIPPPPINNHESVTASVELVPKPSLSQDIINTIVLNGDLSKLSQDALTAYYLYRCSKLGLDPVTKPFDLLTLQGKKVLYANKSCATQLRDLRHISTAIVDEREWNGLLVVRVRAWYQDGRQHEDEGYASLNGLGGDALGNARLKALTKATRRAILNLCGLGEMDETEVETIPNAKTSSFAEARAVLIGTPAEPMGDAKPIRVTFDKNGNVWPVDLKQDENALD